MATFTGFLKNVFMQSEGGEVLHDLTKSEALAFYMISEYWLEIRSFCRRARKWIDRQNSGRITALLRSSCTVIDSIFSLLSMV